MHVSTTPFLTSSGTADKEDITRQTLDFRAHLDLEKHLGETLDQMEPRLLQLSKNEKQFLENIKTIKYSFWTSLTEEDRGCRLISHYTQNCCICT